MTKHSKSKEVELFLQGQGIATSRLCGCGEASACDIIQARRVRAAGRKLPRLGWAIPLRSNGRAVHPVRVRSAVLAM